MTSNQIIDRGFNLFHVLTYIIPGLVALYVVNLYTDINQFLPDFKNEYIKALLFTVSSYIVGHVMHLPATLMGKIVNKIMRVPLIDPKVYSKKGFPQKFKKRLISSLKEYWGDFDDHTYYHLCEVLVENKCPQIWKIHHRWYSISNFLRALILPFLIIGIVVFKYSLIGTVLCIISAMLVSYRYRITKIMSMKQIYLGFYTIFSEKANDKP